MAEEEIEPQLVAGGLTGISGLIQELTQSKTKVKIVEQEEMTLLLEHGKYMTAALVAEENLVILRNKLLIVEFFLYFYLILELSFKVFTFFLYKSLLDKI